MYSPTRSPVHPLLLGRDAMLLLIDNYDSSLTGSTVFDYMVMEAGEWEIKDDNGNDTVIFASSTDVGAVAARTIPDDPGGTVENYPTAFSGAPSVLATVPPY